MEITKKMVEGTATRLKLKDLTQGKVCTVKWEPKLQYNWDDGVAIGRYLEELKNGRIIARRCHKCNRVLVPPRMFCELCWRPTDEWMFVKDTGVVNTFVISHVDWKAGRLDIEGGVRPYTPAVIELDCDSGSMNQVGILHMLDDVDPEKIKIGMKVKAVWKPPEEREGAITDIRYFKPLRAAPAKKAKRRTKKRATRKSGKK
jgi:uncharacterized OB-fold protein